MNPNMTLSPNETTEGGVNRDEAALEEVRLLTAMMRQHADSIVKLSKRRRTLVLRLREHKVTYREIAEAMGTTEQSVYKIIRGDL